MIETGLHYRREVTSREDAARMTKGAAGRNLTTLHIQLTYSMGIFPER